MSRNNSKFRTITVEGREWLWLVTYDKVLIIRPDRKSGLKYGFDLSYDTCCSGGDIAVTPKEVERNIRCNLLRLPPRVKQTSPVPFTTNRETERRKNAYHRPLRPWQFTETETGEYAVFISVTRNTGSGSVNSEKLYAVHEDPVTAKQHATAMMNALKHVLHYIRHRQPGEMREDIVRHMENRIRAHEKVAFQWKNALFSEFLDEPENITDISFRAVSVRQFAAECSFTTGKPLT